MPLRRFPILLVLTCCPASATAWALDDVDQPQPDLLAGLVARYSNEPGSRSAVRIDPDIQFNWQDASPDLRIPASRFRARWKGKLFVPATGTYTFHLYLVGQAWVRVAGQEAVGGEKIQPGWIHGSALELERGYQPIEAGFTKTANHARVGLYWESDRFRLELVAPRWLTHGGQSASELEGFEQGYRLVRAYRCDACHTIPGSEAVLKAPSLARLQVNPRWLVRWLRSSHGERPDARMPEFGLSDDEAQAIAAYLLGQSGSKESGGEENARGNIEAGKSLFGSLGCLGCHRIGGVGNGGLFGGGSLDRIGEKRSLEALRTWLTRPDQLNADHRMPVFELTRREVGDLAAYLSSLHSPPYEGGARGGRKDEPEEKAEGALESLGKQLIEQYRCAACHVIPGIAKPSRAAPLHRAAGAGSLRPARWARSCTGSPDSRVGRPGYGLPQPDRLAIREFLSELPAVAPVQSRFELGRRLLREKGCLGCHARDLARGLQSPPAGPGSHDRDPTQLSRLRGELEPPSLTAVGDKFHDLLLAKLVQGAAPVRRPWVKLRMPRFGHTDSELEALVTFLIDHDRISDVELASGQEGSKSAREVNPSEALSAGQLLISPRGFGCMSCHTVGKHEPKGVAPSARGSDLLAIGERVRHGWFVRWVRDPARTTPGMEMPAVAVPVKGLLDGRIETQIEAMWQGLNSEAFVVPSSREWAEQILVVQPGEQPAVLRDVMFDCPPGSGWCPRGLAIGLPNGHNLLFDLDTMSLRAWWLGDFARQRTEGKTWLWEPGGLPFWSKASSLPNIALHRLGTDRTVLAEKKGQTVGWLESWERRDTGVRLRYRLRFPGGNWVRVAETVRDHVVAERIGFVRSLEVYDVPDGFVPVFLHGSDRPTRVSGSELSQEGALGRFLLRGPQETQWSRLELPSQPLDIENHHVLVLDRKAGGSSAYELELSYLAATGTPLVPPASSRRSGFEHGVARRESLPVVPGYEVIRLPLDRGVMPTAISFRLDGTPVVCSLKGQVFLAKDTDGDGSEDIWKPFSDHLAAPFGVLTDRDAVIVSHKPELLRLEDQDGDGRAERTKVLATGWGYNDNYHDWTFGLVRDSKGRFYVVLGSDYQQKGRPSESCYLRGHALRIGSDGMVEDLARGLRFTAGIAGNREDQVFFTDNQGMQNTFNEINHLVPRSRYGVPALTDPPPEQDPWPERSPAIQLPHPMTRSVNGLCFLEANGKFAPFEGQGIGCEYDTRALIRFSLQKVGETYQGACYQFSLPETADGDPDKQLLGPICCAVSPRGVLYVGGIRDSGWGAGNNVGEMVTIRPTGRVPLGIREVRAFQRGFVIDFTGPVDPGAATDPIHYEISSYRRVWRGSYATPDSDRRREKVEHVQLTSNHRSVVLRLAELRPGFVYDIHVAPIGPKAGGLWPADAYYTLNRIPPGDATVTGSP